MALQQIKPAACRRGFRRYHLLLAIAVSALLHVTAAVWWFSRPMKMHGPEGMQTVPVDLIALAPPASEPAVPLTQLAPPVQEQPAVLPDDEMALKQKVIRKPPVKKPSPQQPVPLVEQANTAAQQPGAVVAQSSATPAPVTAARYDAAYLRNPAPVYPSSSRRLGEEGRVLLRVQVSAEGSPITVQVKQSSGFERLDDAARNAVTKWKFVPAHQNGLALTSWVEVPLQFNLKK